MVWVSAVPTTFGTEHSRTTFALGTQLLPSSLLRRVVVTGHGGCYIAITMPIDDSRMTQTPAAFCEHANEVPSSCLCGSECYCKSHTCLVETINKEMGPTILSEQRGREYREQTDMDSFTDQWLHDMASYKHAQVIHQPVPKPNMLVDSKQPKPVVNQGPAIHKLIIKDLVIRDFNDRGEFGKAKYGTYLQPNNGRDVLKDAYQEALDLCQYLRQLIAERDGE